MARLVKKSRGRGKKAQGRGDFLYENPPLVEVIVELHWRLQKLTSIDGQVDVKFQELLENFQKRMKAAGFSFEEVLIPSQAPIELFGHNVVSRFRKTKGAWPLYQIGPGVFTANIVPPYHGWRAFTPIVETGLTHLIKSYPLASKLLSFERLQLRYINAFDKNFGMNNPALFVRNELRLAVPVPRGFGRTIKGSVNEVGQYGQLEMPIKEPNGAHGTVRWSPGKRYGKLAIVLEHDIRSTGPKNTPQSKKQMLEWLNSAHKVTHTWFGALISSNIKKAMGKKIPI